MYIGGSQKRPDATYARPVFSKLNNQVISQVGEGNRKDIREAVEAAHKAAPGWVLSTQTLVWLHCFWFFRWGKRAAHNRAQIVYYVAENLELRREEFASRISEMTGRAVDECREEVDMSIRRLFHWGAYADKYGGQVQVRMLI